MAEKTLQETSFEGAMERLEQIVEQMESNTLPLEEMLERYEEGTRLVKLCSEKLSAAEKRIEIITRNASGKPEIAEFQAVPPPPASSERAQGAPAPKSGKTAPKTPAPQPRSDDISLF
ncbi:MAG: exodeoxyribonuclease VII small subunit [Verrucomicrobiota bacterium]